MIENAANAVPWYHTHPQDGFLTPCNTTACASPPLELFAHSKKSQMIIVSHTPRYDCHLEDQPRHSMNSLFESPTSPTPRARKPLGSPGRNIDLAGSIGFSGLMLEASLAACSIASISSLHPAWSKGQTTIGCRSRMSRAADNLACLMLASWTHNFVLTYFHCKIVFDLVQRAGRREA